MSTSSTIEKSSTLSFKLSQEQFNQALSMLSKTVSRQGIQPILNNVLIKADEQAQKLLLATTDLDLSLSFLLQAKITEGGEVTILAQKLYELVSKLPHLEFTLSSTENAAINVTCGRSKFELRGVPADQFPRDFLNTEKPSPDATQIKLSTEQLLKAAQLVSFASDKREINSILNGICFEVSERGLELAATDGSRLAYFCLPSIDVKEQLKAVIPFRTINELIRLIGDLPEESISCHFDKASRIVFQTQERCLSSNQVDGVYPKYQQLIPSGHNHRAVVNRQEFFTALERVAVLANERTKVVKLLFEEIGILTVSAQTPDLGEAVDQIDIAQYEGQDFSIAFNVNYMLECLRALDCEKVEIRMTEQLKPVIVVPYKEQSEDQKTEKTSSDTPFDYLYLLMPVQMRNAN
ncbi:MAG: DNA polymerase III subunit beta [Candidatus Caenarcaniphilales bacterium]|nr:DNA polymerase III subunit beta [Candidatus Caenarcaniphilales bacterium]